MKHKLSVLILACIAFVPPSQCASDLPEQIEANPVVEQIEMANALYEQGQYNAAISKYTIVIESDASSSEAYFGRGRALYNLEQYQKAREDFSIATNIDPQYTQAFHYRGWTQIANASFDKAISDFTSSVELDPGLARAYSGRGWAYANKSQWDQTSILYLYQRYESHAFLARVFVGPGWDAVKKEYWELAVVPNLTMVEQENLKVSEAYCYLGFAHVKQAHWSLAIAEYDQNIQLFQESNESPWNREWAIDKKEQWNQVISDYTTVIEIVTGESLKSTINDTSGMGKDHLDFAVVNYNKVIELAEDPNLVRKAEEAKAFIEEWQKEAGF